jgi:hypothetical protein
MGINFDRLFSIPHDDPKVTADTWFDVQPCKTFHVFGQSIVITQPSSSFWVYLLGVLTTMLGVFFIASSGQEFSRLLWGVSLILWGVGALIAGTSYQAFGYQLKVKNRDVVAWTSWWEVIYLIFQQWSINVMFIAVVYSCLPIAIVPASVIAILVSIVYCIVVFYGALNAIKRLITYELMVKVSTPFIFFFIALNTWRFFQTGEMLDVALLGVWLGLIATDRLYWLYYNAGFTQKLWMKGRWFSENDVLHVALIIWVVYIWLVVAPLIKDAPVLP